MMIQQVGPGLFPGDRLRVDVLVEAGADLVVRGQGATKLFPSPSGIPATTVTRLQVGGGGSLCWLPGELIPFRDAVLQQETIVEVAAGGRLALVELLTPGRAAMGEREVYTRLDLRLRISIAGRPVLIERTRLEPALRPLGVLGRHGGLACAGTLYLGGFGAAELGCGEREDAVRWASGRAAAGDVTLVRLLGETPQALRAVIDGLLRRIGLDGNAVS